MVIKCKYYNKRKDFCEKLSLSLVQTYSFIAFEDLEIDEMVQKSDCYIEKHILDAAWNQLVSRTMCKAEDAGTTVVLVNPCNTTKMCSQCGTLVPKDRNEKVHNCPACGLSLGRDLNAAINILRLGCSLWVQSLDAHVFRHGSSHCQACRITG